MQTMPMLIRNKSETSALSRLHIHETQYSARSNEVMDGKRREKKKQPEPYAVSCILIWPEDKTQLQVSTWCVATEFHYSQATRLMPFSRWFVVFFPLPYVSKDEMRLGKINDDTSKKENSTS